MSAGPVLKYPGSKWGLAGWICERIPPHRVYVEPYFGSGAVFFRKPASRLELLNDLDGEVVNLFRVIRERPAELAAVVELTPWAREELAESIGFRDAGNLDEVERARRLLVWTWQQIGRRTDSEAVNGWRWTRDACSNPVLAWKGLPDRIAAAAARLKDAQIECRPALDVIRDYAAGDVLIYADPPYVRSTRRRKMYRHEMADQDHAQMLSALITHPGPVLLSGYEHALYADLLGEAGWIEERVRGFSDGGNGRLEVLWANPPAVEGRLF